jgi:hypothetical protein
MDDARFDRVISHLAWSEHCGFDADVRNRSRHQHLESAIEESKSEETFFNAHRCRRNRVDSARWGGSQVKRRESRPLSR